LKERLQKYIARCGVASRRNSEKIIAQGRVSVNGKIVSAMGIKINPQVDLVRVDGRIITPETEGIYIKLNKPAGYITSVSDPQGRPTVLDLIGDIGSRIYPVGRLDYESEGLLILTNDGELAYCLTHPRYEIDKQYYVLVDGNPGYESIKSLRNGVDIGDHVTQPAKISKLGIEGRNSIYRVTISEGRNRQVRRMFEVIGHPVLYLKRERLGNISLGSLRSGEWRHLSISEIKSLKSLIENEI
jgi:23S rRNA pseudouridine2605 synthase